MDLDSYSDTLTKPRTISHLSQLEDLLRALSPGERLVLYTCTILLGVSAVALIIGLNATASVSVPAPGGSFTEGEIGSARFINPTLTLSQPDEDISALVYSGLIRVRPDGAILPDLASDYRISPDGTTYTFTIRPDAVFHDGKPVTAADVLFTIETVQNPAIKSPRRSDWEGVHASSPDPRTVVFTLPHTYAPFIENATLGILPKHIWQNISAEEFPFSPANTHPVGSGPFRVSRTTLDDTGTAVRYDLAPFTKYALGTPYLKRITFIFYPNREEMIAAFEDREIDAMSGIAPDELAHLKRNDFSVAHVALPRVFGVFFNQSHAPVLADAAARQALAAAVDPKQIMETVLQGYGAALRSAIPPGVTGTIVPAVPGEFLPRASGNASTTPDVSRFGAARDILSRGGWTFDEAAGVWKKKKLELSFTLATADEPELVTTANEVAKYWRAAGVKVTIQVYPLSELNTNVIRPRAYDAVLFGEVVGRTADLFAFWHSSQRNDPGLNLAMYANSRVDVLLAEARATIDRKRREKLYDQFNEEIRKDAPAVFLYAPEFIYVVPKFLLGVELGPLTAPSERYLNAHEWYTDTERVWSIFTNKSSD
ncbi:MAG: peptide ABC transporter substrate-binding protein [Patescibacteria group bacterium]